LFSGLTRRSSGCGQILDEEPQLGPRENPFFHKRQQGRSRHLQRSLNQNFAHALSIPQLCKHSVISARDSKVTDQPDAIFSEWDFFAGDHRRPPADTWRGVRVGRAKLTRRCPPPWSIELLAEYFIVRYGKLPGSI
jgi:hypothetical protein